MPGNTEEKEKCLEKLNQMQKFLPFLDYMIHKIKKKNNEVFLQHQLAKFQHLRSMISEKNGKYTWDVVVKVEEVIEKLISKLDYKEQCKKSEEKNSKKGSRVSSSKSVDIKATMATSLSPIPSSMTTTISVTSASGSQVRTVSSKHQDSTSSTVDLIMKKLKMSVECSQKENEGCEDTKETLCTSRAFQERLKSDMSEKSLETDLDKDLDGFDLMDCSNVTEAESKATSVGSTSESSSSRDDLLSSSREKLLKSLQSRLYPCKSDRTSSHSSEAKAKEKGSDSAVSAFSSNRTKTNPSERNSKSDFHETGRSSDLDKISTSKTPKEPDAHNVTPGFLNTFLPVSKSRVHNENDSGLKQKLRQKLSSYVNEVYKVTGKSVGGSLRSLKETKDHKRKSVADDEVEELFKPIKATEGPSRSSGSRSKSTDNSRSTSDKHCRDSSPKKSDKSSSGGDREPRQKKESRHESYSKEKSKEKKNSGNGKKSSKKKEEKSSEIDNLNDEELLEFVKENMQSLPHLAKLKPVELRKAVQSSLSNKSTVPINDVVNISSDDSFQDLDEFMNDMGVFSDKFNAKNGSDTQGNSKSKLNDNSEIHPLASVKVSEVGPDGVAKNVKPIVEPCEEVKVLEVVGDRTDDIDSISGDDEEDYAQKLIDETTPQVVSTKKKGILELPLPLTDDLLVDIASVEGFDTSPTSSDNRDPRRRKFNENKNKPNFTPESGPESIRPNESSSAPSSNFNQSLPFPSQSASSDNNGKTQRNEEKADWPLKPIVSHPIPDQFNQFSHFHNRCTNESRDSLRTFLLMTPTYPNEPPRRNSFHSEPKSYAEYKRLKLMEKQKLGLLESAPKKDSKNSTTENVKPSDVSRPPTEKEEMNPSASKASDKRNSWQKDSLLKQKNPKTQNQQGKKNKGQRRHSDNTDHRSREELLGRKSHNDNDDKRKKIGTEKRLSSDSEEVVSPLEKLYQGENKPKTGRGYGIQKFKIPKKVRETKSGEDKIGHKDTSCDNAGKEVSQTKASGNDVDSSVEVCDTEKEKGSKTYQENLCKTRKVENSKSCERVGSAGKLPKTDANVEGKSDSLTNPSEPVTIHSTAEGKKETLVVLEADSVAKDKQDVVAPSNKNADKPALSTVDSPQVEGVKKCEAEIVECDSSMETAPLNNISSGKEKTGVVSKEEITQEFVEALIRKSFQSGEGKLLLAQAKLFEEFARKLNSKKLKTIQKIINSESGSSSSSSDSSSEDEKKKKKGSGKEKVQKSKKRKKKGKKSKKHKFSSSSSSSSSSESEETSEEDDCDKNEEEKSKKTENLPTPNKSANEENKISNKQKESKSPSPILKTTAKNKKRRKGIDFGGCISRKKATRKQGQKKLLEQILNEEPQQDTGVDSNISSPADPPAKESEPKAKAKQKAKGKTELDRLHDDIRSMFISSGVVTATGQRMCRILRESGGNMNNLDIVKESAKMVEEERLKRVKTRASLRSSRANASRQESRSRSQSSDKVRDRSTSGSRENQQELNEVDHVNSKLEIKLSRKQPQVLLKRVDLNNFGYWFKISEGCLRFRKGRGQNKAMRGRKWGPLSRNKSIVSPPNLNLSKVFLERNKRKFERLKQKKCKKPYTGKKLMDIVKNLPLKMAKMKHLEICERHEEKSEEIKKNVPGKGSSRSANKRRRKARRKNLVDVEILNYAFDKKRVVYPCKLCSHVTRNITGHYTAVHPESEVLISRLCQAEARKAKADSAENNYDVTVLGSDSSLDAIKRRLKSKLSTPSFFHCRMCSIPRTTDLSAFFTHVTTHTGEYIYQCPAEGCTVKMSTRDYIKFHIVTKHPKLKCELYNKITELFPIPVEGGRLYGFLCAHCNYVQISQKNVENHVLKQHSSIENVKIIKIDMSSKMARKRKRKKRKNIANKFIADSDHDKNVAYLQKTGTDEVNEATEGRESRERKRKFEGTTSETGAERNNDEYDQPEKKKLLEKEETQDISQKIMNIKRDDEAGENSSGEAEMNAEGTEEIYERIDTENYVDLKDISAIKGSDIIEPIENGDKMESSSGSVPKSGTSTKLRVGLLEAQLLDDSEVLYECYVKGCFLSTKVFDLFEKHITISHWKTKWDGTCRVCSSTREKPVYTGYTKLSYALKHLKAHVSERTNGGSPVENLKVELRSTSEEGKDGEEESQESNKEVAVLEHSTVEGEHENRTVAEVEKSEAIYPAKPLLRVRNLLGDRLSRPKESTEEHEVVAIEEESNSLDTPADSTMFTIENVRSLNSESELESSEIDIESVCSTEKIKRDKSQKPLLNQGKPVLVRSCPTRKIAIRPESSALSIEVGHLNVVSSPVAGSMLLNSLPNASPNLTIVSSLSPLRSPPKTKFAVQPIIVSASSFIPGSNVVSVIRSVSPGTQTLSSSSYSSPQMPSVEVDKGLPSSMASQTVILSKTGADDNISPAQRPHSSSPIQRPTTKSPSGTSSEKEDLEPKDPKNFQRLHSRPDIKNKSVKDIKIYQEMLTKTKLCHLFKCMAIECSFSCNDEVIFTQHIGLHEAQRRMKKGKKGMKGMYIEFDYKQKKMFNWQQCAYCCEVLVNSNSGLSQHILVEHGHCIFQCAYCFYRAVTQTYVEIHQKIVHGQLLKTKPRLIYKCRPLSRPPAAASALEKHGRRQSVRPYQCDQCGAKFFITQEFMNHLTTEHQSVTAYTCHICKNLCFKADRLIVHYKLHSYCTYQCAYCLHGTETQNEMLFHLCNFHFSQPPYMYVRALSEGQCSSDDPIKKQNKKKKFSSSQLDSLKVIAYENENVNADYVVEAASEEEKEDGGSRDTASLDLSAIVAELGINTDSQATANVSPLIKELASIGNKTTENLTVKNLLPNAQFSSEIENWPESCSVLISSGLSSTSDQNEEKEMNIPLGQLPLEAVNVQRREGSPTPTNIGSPDKNLKLNEIIVNLHSKEKGFMQLSNAEEERVAESATPNPSSAVHKLPPIVLSRSSCTKVYPPKQTKTVNKKSDDDPKVGESAERSLHCRRISETGETVSSGEKNKEKEGKVRIERTSSSKRNIRRKEKGRRELCQQPLITKVISLVSEGSSNESIIISDVCSFAIEQKQEVPRPLLPLMPPIIRVEDFPISENGTQSSNTVNIPKTECEETAFKVNPDAENPDGGLKPEDSVPPRSPDIIILEEGKSTKNIETVILDSEDEKEENILKEENPQESNVIVNLSDIPLPDDLPQESNVVINLNEIPLPDDKIRKEMEHLRNKIANETDSLLFDDSESEKVAPPSTLTIEPCKEGEDRPPALLSPIEEAISSLNKKLQSESSQAREREEDRTESNSGKNSEGKEADLPRTRSGARIRREEDVGEKTGEDVKKDDPGKNKKYKEELSGKDLYVCGNDKCNFSAENNSLLKEHMYVCDLSRETSVLVCPHCSKQLKHFNPYLEHLKYHGEKKFHCGLCSFSSAVDMGALRHVKQKHKCSSVKFLPKEGSKEGHSVCYPKNYKVEKSDSEMNSYSPGDEDKLPLQSVYQVNVKCAKCPYFTKVRSNMVRHLKIHVKSVETEGVVVVPSTAPTNPVPCLEKKERMFDKMTNLAASSQMAQAKEKTALLTLAPEEEAKLPQFVAEQMRYKCCLPDCNYITIDDGMLKHHIKALHDEINYYSCPHCRSTVHVDIRHVTLDKIGHHLKHHDSRLYKCAHCIYFHYQKTVVEKHVVEKHPDRRYYVYTVREPKPEATSEEEHSSSEGGGTMWKCGLCSDFACSSKAGVMEHLGKSHNTKSKYKCRLCFMKSNTYQAFFGHFASKHAGEKIQYVRTILKVNSGEVVESPSGNSSGADSSNEHFDTTPLWQRGAPRVRHIRGILIDEEEVKTKKSKRASVENENEGEVLEAAPAKKNAFCCPLCTDKKKVFYTRSEDYFRTHLYQELNYQQFACILCGKMFVDKKDFERHHAHAHPDKPPSMKQTKEDGEIMFWVQKVIAKQLEQMKEKKRQLSESDESESQGPPKKKREV